MRHLVNITGCTLLAIGLGGCIGEPLPGPAAYRPGYAAPGYAPQQYVQPGYQQPVYQQPGYPQPDYQQPGYQQPDYRQPEYAPRQQDAAYGGTCYAGVYTCALAEAIPAGSQCSCPGLGVPSYGTVR